MRDTFAAVFFFWFGLTIDPGDAGSVAVPVAAAVVLSLVLNVVAGLLAARLQGYGPEAAANIGLTILGRGEFSLILATLAAAAGLDRAHQSVRRALRGRAGRRRVRCSPRSRTCWPSGCPTGSSRRPSRT